MIVFKTISKWGSGLATCALLISALSCSNNKGTNELTDPQVASIAITANQIDVAYGNLALEKSDNPEIKKFAQTMVKDHQDIINQAMSLVEKLGVTPENNDFTKALLEGEKAVKKNLGERIGAKFDMAYIDNEVTYHKAVIATLKDSLIPAAKNNELKALLIRVHPLLQHHLEMAETTQEKMLEASAALPKFNDAQITSVVVIANQIDVNYGKTALEKSEDPHVLMFAKMMIKDHGEIMNQALKLAQKLKIVPEESEFTQTLYDDEKNTSKKLKAAEGKDFNSVYIDNEVAYHTAVIDILKNILIPQATNEELKQVLIDITPLLEDHLKMMKEEQSKIEG